MTSERTPDARPPLPQFYAPADPPERAPTAALVERAQRWAATPEPTIGPISPPCDCGCRQHQHRGAGGLGGCSNPACSTATAARAGKSARSCVRFRVDAGWALAQRALRWADARSVDDLNRYADQQRAITTAGRPAGQIRVGPSDYDACARAVYYREIRPPGLVVLPEHRDESAMGTAFHTAAEAAQKTLYPWRQFERRFTLPGLTSGARVDVYDPITGDVTDLKTAGRWRWDRLGEEGASWSWWGQVSLYGTAIMLAGLPARRARIEAVNRENGRTEVFVRAWDEEMDDLARAAHRQLLNLEGMLTYGGVPDRGEPGPSLSGLCRRCPFRVTCWDMTTAEALGRSPESWTHLGEAAPLDDTGAGDPQHAWAVAQAGALYARAKEAEKDAAAAYAEAMALLRGLPHGRYHAGDAGVWEYSQRNNGTYSDRKTQVQRLLTALDQDPSERRPRHELEYPPVVAKATTPQVVPVRAARDTRKRAPRRRVVKAHTSPPPPAAAAAPVANPTEEIR